MYSTHCFFCFDLSEKLKIELLLQLSPEAKLLCLRLHTDEAFGQYNRK